MTGIAAVAFAVAVVAAIAQATTGFGSALVVVPLLTISLGPESAVVSATVMSAALSAYAMARHRRHVAWRSMLTVSMAALLGMPLGLLALSWLSERTLTALIGGVLLLFIFVIIRGFHLPQRSSTEAVVGIISGGLLTSTGMNGPPIVAAFQAMRLPPVTLRATLLSSLCFQDLAAVCGFASIGRISPVILFVVAAGLPGLALGWFVGDLIFARFRPRQFRWAILTMLTVSAVTALIQAIVF